MAVDAGPGEDFLLREQEEEELRRSREERRDPVAGPAPAPVSQEPLPEEEPLPVAGPASAPEGFYKPGGVDVTRYDDRDFGGSPVDLAVSVPSMIAGFTGVSTAINRTGHAIAAEQASEDYYQQYIKDPDRQELIDNLIYVHKYPESEIQRLIEEERRWLDGMRVSRPDRLIKAHYPPVHIEEGEENDPYVRDHWAYKLTPNFLRTKVNEGVSNNPLVQADPEYYQSMVDDGRVGVQRGADRFAELQRDYLYSTKSSPMVRAWVDWNESVDRIEKLKPEVMEAIINSSAELGVGLKELALQTVGVGALPEGYTRAEYVNELGESLGLMGAAGFFGAVSGNFTRSLRYNPSPLLLFLAPAVGKMVSGTASPAVSFTVNQMAKTPGVGKVVTQLKKAFEDAANVETPFLVRQPGKVDKGKTDIPPDPGGFRPGEFRPQRVGEAVKEAVAQGGLSALLGVPQYGLSLMALRGIHRSALTSGRYRDFFNERIAKYVERNRQAEDLETAERGAEVTENIGRPARRIRSAKEVFADELSQPDRTEALPLGIDEGPISGEFQRRPTRGEAFVGQTTARKAPLEEGASVADAPAPTPDAPPAAPAPTPDPVAAPEPPAPRVSVLAPEVAEAPMLYEAPLGKDTFVSVVSPEDAASARRATADAVRQNAIERLSRQVDEQARIDKQGKKKEEIAAIERQRQAFQKELKELATQRDRQGVQREPSAMRLFVREAVENRVNRIETEALGPNGVVQQTLSNLRDRFGKRSVDRAYEKGLREGLDNGGITLGGQLIEGSPLEAVVRKGGGSALVGGQWVARPKSKKQIQAKEKPVGPEEALGEKAPELVTYYDVSQVDGTKQKQGRMSARTEEGAIPVDEKQIFTDPKASPTFPKQARQRTQREDAIKEIMKAEKTDRVFAEILYDDFVAAETKKADAKANRTPEQVSVDRFNNRIDGFFSGLKKAFSVKDETVAPDILFRRSEKGDRLPLTEKLRAEGKSQGNTVYGTQRGYVKLMKQIVADIARDPNLSAAARVKLLERFQRNANESLFPPKERANSQVYKTARQELEAIKGGEIPISIQAASRPTSRMFVDSDVGLRSVVKKLQKKLANRDITLDEYTAALHEHLYQLTEDVAGIRNVSLNEVNSIQAVLAALRGKADAEGKVRGPASDVNFYNTRVGRWALERVARVNQALRERKDVTFVGKRPTVASELQPVFNYLKQEIRNAEDKAYSRPGTRYNQHLQIARNHWRGMDVTGQANPRFIRFLDKIVKERAANRAPNMARLRKELADANMTRPEKYTLERIIDTLAASDRNGGTITRAKPRATPLDKIMKDHDSKPRKEVKEVTAKVGSDKLDQRVFEPAKISDMSYGYSRRFINKLGQIADEVIRVNKNSADNTALPVLRRFRESIKSIFEGTGDSLILSDSMKRAIADQIVADVAQGLTKPNVEAARQAVMNWLGQYDLPMNVSKMSDRFIDAPFVFRLLNSDGSVLRSYALNNIVEGTFNSLKPKEQKQVVREATGRLLDRMSEYGAEKATEQAIRADRQRWGYSDLDTPLTAAIKMARAVLLYNDANPLFPPSVIMKPNAKLTKEMGTPTPVMSPTRIKVTEYGDVLRANKQAVIDDFNAHMMERRGRKMNKKEIETLFGKDKEGYSPQSKMGRFIKNLDEQTNFADDSGRHPMMDLLDQALGLAKDEDKDKARSDERLPQDRQAGPFDTFVDKGWREDIGWEVGFQKQMANLGPQLTMYLKQKVTSESTLTNIGNTLSNVMAIALTTGEMPLEIAYRLLATSWSYHKYMKNPKDYTIKNPELAEAFKAANEQGLRTTNFADVELGSPLDVPSNINVSVLGKLRGKINSHGELMRLRDMAVMGGGAYILGGPAVGGIFGLLAGIIGPKRMGKYREARRKAYSEQDNIPKVGEFTRHYIDTKRWLDMHDVGDTVSIQTTRNGRVFIKKTGKGETGWQIGVGPRWDRRGRPVKEAELQKIIGSYASRRTYRRIFNYGDAPRILKKMRNSGVIGAFSQFMSYPYFAADLPGKPGIVSGTIMDNFNTGLTSSNSKANFQLAAQAVSQSLRKTMMAAQVQRMTHPFQHDLSNLANFGAESAFNSDAIIWDLDNPNAVATVRTANADSYKKTKDVAVMALAHIAMLRGEPLEKDPPKRSYSLAGRSLDAIDRIVESNARYFRNKVQTGQTLQPKDYAALFELTGTQMLGFYTDMTKGTGAMQSEMSPVERAVSRIAGALMGVDAANTAKVLRGTGVLNLQDPDPDHPYSAFRYELKARRELYPRMSKAEEARFMIDNAVSFALNVYPRTKVLVDKKNFNSFTKMIQRSLNTGMIADLKQKLASPGITAKEKIELQKEHDLLKAQIDIVMKEKREVYQKIKEVKGLKQWQRANLPVKPETLKLKEDRVIGGSRKASEQRSGAALRKLRELEREE